MGEDISHALVHDLGHPVVEELRVGGSAALGQAGNGFGGLEAMPQRIVQVEDDVDPILAEFGQEVIQTLERTGVVAQAIQPVQPGDVDALPPHVAERVIGLFLAPVKEA